MDNEILIAGIMFVVILAIAAWGYFGKIGE